MKSPFHSIKHTTYFEIYDNLFSQYRGKEITFVEIGVLSGGSLFMWRDFFGPKARIIGVEMNPNAKKWEEHGFEIFIGSQSDESFWDNFKKQVGNIDIVLDDGGHTYEQQIVTTECLLDNINDGGMLVIEDTHTSYMKKFGNQKYSFIEYTKHLIDLMNYRFGKFSSQNKADYRVWSIEIYESIVAFKINKKATMLISELTENDGKTDKPKDFRDLDYTAFNGFDALTAKFPFLKYIPLLRAFFRRVQKIKRNTKSAKKYFR